MIIFGFHKKMLMISLLKQKLERPQNKGEKYKMLPKKIGNWVLKNNSYYKGSKRAVIEETDGVYKVSIGIFRPAGATICNEVVKDITEVKELLGKF